MKTRAHTEPCTQMLLTALFIIGKRWKQPNCQCSWAAHAMLTKKKKLHLLHGKGFFMTEWRSGLVHRAGTIARGQTKWKLKN